MAYVRWMYDIMTNTNSVYSYSLCVPYKIPSIFSEAWVRWVNIGKASFRILKTFAGCRNVALVVCRPPVSVKLRRAEMSLKYYLVANLRPKQLSRDIHYGWNCFPCSLLFSCPSCHVVTWCGVGTCYT